MFHEQGLERSDMSPVPRRDSDTYYTVHSLAATFLDPLIAAPEDPLMVLVRCGKASKRTIHERKKVNTQLNLPATPKLYSWTHPHLRCLPMRFTTTRNRRSCTTPSGLDVLQHCGLIFDACNINRHLTMTRWDTRPHASTSLYTAPRRVQVLSTR